MEPSQVWYTDMRAKPGLSMISKLERLVEAAGIRSLDWKKRFTALKIHFGEPGNLAFIRPQYVAPIVRILGKEGAKPFLTDAGTLYAGRRSNAVDHLRSALENGFSRDATGCDLVIADGLRGRDQVEIETGTQHCPRPRIAAAIAQADAVVSLTHFKGHELAGFGGTLKNLGMGCASRLGKLELHSAMKPHFDRKKCVGCGVCVHTCAQNAIVLDGERKAVMDPKLCVGCGQCMVMCRFNAVSGGFDEGSRILNEKIAEYSLAVLKGKVHFHLSFVMQVTPDCDCWGYNDTPVVPDLGIFASLDPVALDQACADAVKAATGLAGTVLPEPGRHAGEDKFRHLHPDTDWEAGLAYAEKIGLGSRRYHLALV